MSSPDKITLNFVTWIDPDLKEACCYCLETWSGNLFTVHTKEEAIAGCLEQVNWELQHRFHYNNLKTRGWLIDTENKTFKLPEIDIQGEIDAKFKRLVDFGYPENFKNYDYFSSNVIVPDAIYHDT